MSGRCPYCHRPLRRLGTRCLACRRFVFNWFHLSLLTMAALAGLILLLEFL